MLVNQVVINLLSIKKERKNNMFSDNNDGYISPIQDTISSIKVLKKREGNLVSKEVKLRDKELSESRE